MRPEVCGFRRDVRADRGALRVPFLTGCLLLAGVSLAGCASPGAGQGAHAPVEERVAAARKAPPRPARPTPPPVRPVDPAVDGAVPGSATGAGPAPAAAGEARPPRGIENLGQPGHHQVQSGETLIRIAQLYGQNWRNLVRWNQIDNPDRIEVGDVLRVVPPGGEVLVPGARVAASRPVTGAGAAGGAGGPAATPARVPSTPGVSGAPAVAGAAAPATGDGPAPGVGRPASSAASGAAASAGPLTSAAAASAPAAPSAHPGGAAAASAPVQPSRAEPPASAPAESDLAWSWPVAGRPSTRFEEGRSRGIQIPGDAGDAVLAAADGRVIYAGDALRGYGNLVIIKHNARFISAYGHNRKLLVTQDMVVRRGQKIAEMGSVDADAVVLHFEVRRDGKPVDPLGVLPAR
ncbi:MAG: hypothetical protein RLY78_1623 [Pseudomonadota bacterium]